jgi:uncharacterized protein (DUF736 family)
MRKRIVDPAPSSARLASSEAWLDLAQTATVEVTSEDPNFPIESVFSSESGRGWRAAQKGEQQVRLVFDDPVSLHRIQLHFIEPEYERTQEFTIRWSSAESGQPREIVRQQWNFSPSGSTSEVEDYEVQLDHVCVLELVIRPDLTYDQAPATLASWRLA